MVGGGRNFECVEKVIENLGVSACSVSNNVNQPIYIARRGSVFFCITGRDLKVCGNYCHMLYLLFS